MFGLMDNPYEFHLYFWPAVLALLALFPKQRKFKVLILVLASIVYWAILQPSVEWALIIRSTQMMVGQRHLHFYLVGCLA